MRIVTIQGKIADLRELGFVDPVKMITSSPAILNYAIANVRAKSPTCASSASTTQ